MSEGLGPSPEEMGIEVERPIEVATVSDLVQKIDKIRQEADPAAGRIKEYGQMRQAMLELVENTPEAAFPEVFDRQTGLTAGEELLAHLANHPDLFSNVMSPNERWLSLKAIAAELPKDHIADEEMIIVARQLQVPYDRPEGGQELRPNHLSITADDLATLEGKVSRLHLFVTFPESGQQEATSRLVTLDLKALGLDAKDKDKPKMLVIPYDVFANPAGIKQENITESGTAIPALPSAEGFPGITNFPELEQQERLQQLIEACREVATAEELEGFQETDDWDEAVTLAASLLVEKGIEDPVAYLTEKGVLE